MSPTLVSFLQLSSSAAFDILTCSVCLSVMSVDYKVGLSLSSPGLLYIGDTGDTVIKSS